MGLIKKYEAGNTMNYSFDVSKNKKKDKKQNISFDNTDVLQQKLVKKQYDKYATGINSSFNSATFNNAEKEISGYTPKSMDDINSEASNRYQKKEVDYSPMEEKRQYQTAQADNQMKMGSSTASAGLQALGTASSMASKSMDAAKLAGNANKVGSGVKALAGAGKAIPWVQAGIAVAETLETAKKAIKTNDYGEGKNTSSNTLKEFIDMSSPANSAISDWKNSRANGENIVASGGRAVLGSMGVTSIPKMISAGFGKTNEKSGVFGAINKFTGVAKTHARVDAEKADIDAATKAENERIAKEKKLFTARNTDILSTNNLMNSGSNSKIYKKGGKLIPRFRRGGELDLEKENVILDGPSHDDHNSTGVKGDKGLPVVNKGVKVAEIESLELILNKKSSDEVEKLTNQYKKTGDKKILDKIGSIMKKEINDNTYDYSKELLK